MSNTYGDYIRFTPATPETIERAEEEMRQAALRFLRTMDQPMEKMSDVQIITHEQGGAATVGWKVAI